MKGKTKALLNTIICTLALLLASVGLLNLFNRKEKIYASTIVADEEFSARYSDGIIMSVEKVAIAEDYTEDITADNPSIKSFLAPNDKTYYYADIPNGDKAKTVVENNKYIMLNNNATDGARYYNSNIRDIYKDREAGTIANASEAIMFSFGAYVYDETTEQVYNNAEHSSKLQYLNIQLDKGGKELFKSCSTRLYEYEDMDCQDFVYVLKQHDIGQTTDLDDGYYTFTIQYKLHGGNMQTKTFSFYLIYESSYTNEYFPSEKVYSYTAKPTLSVFGSALTPDANNINHYRLGDSQNYPTLTYDYTKYSVGYTYTANGNRSTYNYVYNAEEVSGGIYKTLTCEITESGVELTPVVYKLSSTNNLAVIVFTEVGTYNFTFDYIYTGENKENAPDITESLKIDSETLQIHGFEAKYSKDGYDEAQLRYATFSTDVADGVDLIVPNGYLRESEELPLTDSLPLLYSEDSTATSRVGCVVKDEDALVNTQLDITLEATINGLVNGEEFETAKSYIATNKINYVKTNQNSVWFSKNDQFDMDTSYYYYSKTNPSAFTLESRKSYTNVVSFVDPGYYLVLIHVTCSPENYYQVFAFQITSKTIVAQLTKQIDEEHEEEIGSGDFTNKNIKITWEEPATFERQISAQYHVANDVNLDEATLLKRAPIQIENGSVVGESVANGHFAKYLIEVKSEGESSISHVVTIDRQEISNIGLYEIDTIYSGTNSKYNVIRQTGKNTYAQVNGLITDSAVTLYWDNKNSGAGITAKYWRWDFAENKSSNVTSVFNSSAQSWFSNKYQLAENASGAITGILKANSMDAEVQPKYVYRESGVYLFELTDQAGNSCYYMFVLDKTPTYFKVDNEFVNAQAKLFASSVNVEVSTHKAIKTFDEISESPAELVNIIKSSTDGQTILSAFIKLATIPSESSAYLSNFKNAGYYNGDAEINKLQSMFAQTTEAYLIVKNMYMYGYDSEQHQDASLHLNIQEPGASMIKTIEDKATDTTSTIRNLYLIGENQIHADEQLNYEKIKGSKSYVVVEINSDNSRGMVYYSDNDIDETSFDGRAARLYTGNNIQGAHATDANHVAFVWTFGSAEFEIDSITYDYYALNKGNFRNSDVVAGNEGSYYYTTHVKTENIYIDNAFVTGVTGGSFETEIGTQGYALINIKNNLTQPGLYVVTRTYKTEVISGLDVSTRKYYFIVDRYGIVSTTEANFARQINISMLGDESECNEFESVGYTTGRFSYENQQTGITEEDNTEYTIYLSTSKLPAKINVPVGKYFDGENGSTYYAGKLKFTLYFVDRFSQLVKEGRENTTIKLFSVDLDATQIRDGYYTLDLNEVAYSYRSFFLQEGNNKDWICLPGDYIIVLTDNVENKYVARPKEYIGFRIVKAEQPYIDILAASKQGASYNIISTEDTYNIVTSAEIVTFTLPAYDINDTYAQVDSKYLVVEEYYNGNKINFINYPYTAQGGESLDTESKHVHVNADGSRIIELDTELVRDASGKVDTSKLNIPLYYKVTIRYKLSNASSLVGDEFRNCYYYFEKGEKVYYYETTYTITIDRIAPTNNIKYLEEHDALYKHYLEDGETSLFRQGATENSSGLYFTNTYADASLEKLYAFVVTNDTPFDTTDVAAVYYNTFENVGELHWSPSQVPDGTYFDTSSLTSFRDLGISQFGTYVEILEIDQAGNTAQYLVYYCATEDGVIDPSYYNMSLTIAARQYTTSGLEEEFSALTLNVNEDGKNFTIYEVSSSGNFVEVNRGLFNETFYYISLVDLHTSKIKFSMTTNGKTDFANKSVPNKLVEGIKAAGQGNYRLNILTQNPNKTYSAVFDYYTEKYPINAKDLVTENKDFIVLNKANKVTAEGITYYARKIQIIEDGTSQTYECIPQDGEYSYYLDGAKVPVNIPTKLNATYQLIVTDVFGEISIHRFRTGADGDDFIKVIPTGVYFEYNPYYYVFDETKVTFDKNIYTIGISYTLNGTAHTLYVDSPENEVYGEKHLIKYDKTTSTITMYPYSKDLMSYAEIVAGVKLEVTISFYYNGALESEYKFMMDSSTQNVALRDINNVGHEMQVNYNVGPDFYNKVTDFGVSTSGTMNLSWARVSNNYYVYSYRLHEKMNDGTIKVTELNGVTNKVISTNVASEGKYYFEIIVHSNPQYTNGTSVYVGNKVFAFAVKAVPSDLYYVENDRNEAIPQVSTFSASDVPSISQGTLPTKDMPLYISNGKMNVVYDSTQGINVELYLTRDLGEGYKFEVYKIEQIGLPIYIGLLQVPKTESLISNILKYDDEEWDTSNVLERAYVANNDVKLQITPRNIGTLQLKNLILIDVYYNGQFVKTFTPSVDGRGIYTLNYTNYNYTYNYTIKGSGEYVFMFRDLAGNKHVFNALSEAFPTNFISLSILREIVLTVENNENVTAPIDNAYYNGEVKVSVYNETIYESNIISLTATRNNETYVPTKVGYVYTFNLPGTYRLKFSVNYNNKLLRKTLVFTIINPNECRENINLTTISGYTITKVTKRDGTDVTTAFLKMLNNSDKLLTYETLIEHSESLGLSSGKQYFKIDYKVEAGTYPERSASFAFEMNNEIPRITCSLEPGETTSKGFTITYNAKIIYDQVGECMIYVNNKSYLIDENSANGLSTINVTQKEDGTGDYYVSLQTSSGNIISSFKVIIKEPLNVWAILIIIVAVGAVSAVVITIIVLRNKMKIR